MSYIQYQVYSSHTISIFHSFSHQENTPKGFKERPHIVNLKAFLHDLTHKNHISALFTDKNPYEFEFNGNRYKLEFVADSVVITLKAILSPSKQCRGKGGVV